MKSASDCPNAPQCVFITGTGTDAGKTVATAALLRAFLCAGVDACAVKIVQTGVSEKQPELPPVADERIYMAACADMAHSPARAATLHKFPLAASPHLAAGREGKTLSVKNLRRDMAMFAQARSADFYLLEGAGGIHVPLNDHEDMLDLMRELDYPVLLVCANILGGINHSLLGIDTLEAAGLSILGIVLSDILQPENSDSRLVFDDNEKYLRQRIGRTLPLVRLQHCEKMDATAWNKLASAMEPHAQSLLKIRPGKPVAGIIKKDHAHLWHPYASATNPPVLEVVQRSRGNRIITAGARELVDGMSSWWAAIHGYNHPVLINALKRQAGRLPHVMFGGFTHEAAVGLANRLQDVLPAGLERIFFADSGSVAVEVAMKMALQYHIKNGVKRRTRFLTVRGGYHGDTMGAMSVCDPINGMHELFTDYLPKQLFMDRPASPFGGTFRESDMDLVLDCFSRHENELAAVIIEPIVQGAGGMWFYHPAYLQRLAALCREYGILLILDEIATGFGRTGKYFAAEWAGVNPDILCCGKALTGGVMSFAATACTRRVAEGICAAGRVFMHGPTFMANPLACAVASASMDILAENRWQEQVKMLEGQMRSGLFPCSAMQGVRDVRVLGAIGVVEMEDAVNVTGLHKFFVRRGVWLRPFNRLIYLMPPYITPMEDIDALCAAVRDAIDAGVWKK